MAVAEAVAAARRQKPDLIVLDLMMPEVSGFDVVEQLRAHAETADIPIMVVTAMELTPADRAKLNGYVSMVLGKTELRCSHFRTEAFGAPCPRRNVTSINVATILVVEDIARQHEARGVPIARRRLHRRDPISRGRVQKPESRLRGPERCSTLILMDDIQLPAWHGLALARYRYPQAGRKHALNPGDRFDGSGHEGR